jgi:hypothetical protein
MSAADVARRILHALNDAEVLHVIDSGGGGERLDEDTAREVEADIVEILTPGRTVFRLAIYTEEYELRFIETFDTDAERQAFDAGYSLGTGFYAGDGAGTVMIPEQMDAEDEFPDELFEAIMERLKAEGPTS